VGRSASYRRTAGARRDVRDTGSPAQSSINRKATTARRRQITALAPWFHNLHFPDGTQTAPDHFLGGDFPAFKWREIAPALPARLDGWQVLDVGCNAGFYSFELARRGALVTAIDVDPHYLAQARWACKEFGLESRVRFRQMEVYEIASEAQSFDLVWFMGVFYHLRYPLLALDLLAQRTRRLMVFQTLTMPGDSVYEPRPDYPIDERTPLLESGWPKMAFIERRFSGDPTNWWVPNHAGVEAMLRSAGLSVSSRPAHEVYVCKRVVGRKRPIFASQLESIAGLVTRTNKGSRRPR
jgi:tRNA (mo5U34)-methyltransferase